MPVNVHVPAETNHPVYLTVGEARYYKYPDGIDLRPGSAQHEQIKNYVLDRAKESYDVMSRRHPYWNKIDETLTAYIEIDEKEKAVQNKDYRKPVSIVVPYSYATLETLLTYMVSAFLDMPIFKYEGVTDNDTIGTILLEQVIQQQSIFSKMGLSLHTIFRDAFSYGFGVGTPIWFQKYGFRRITLPDGSRERVEDMLFEGNRIDVIDPYCYLPDINVPIHEVQRGESVGWIDKSCSYVSLLEAESLDPDMYNVRYLKGIRGTSTILNSSDPSSREARDGGSSRGNTYGTTNPIDVIWMVGNIVPSDSEWKLGKKEYPEKWLFGLAADQVVIKAMPLNLDHDMYPVVICAPDYDGHSMTPISRLELINGLQGVLDFLFNSHVTNVRKSINDMLIVDPFLVNMKDLENPGPGKLIRMRRNAWGRGVQNAVQQLAVSDVTRQHIGDAAAVIDFMNNTSSAVDSVRGVMKSSGERRSATEAKGARMSALTRLARGAKVASMMTMQDLAYMIASQTQQLMSRETFVSTMGRSQEMLVKEYGPEKGHKVYPEDVDVQYNVIPHDGTIEMGERADSWTNLYQVLATNPAVGQGFDMVRIFKHIARMLGAKNVNEFVQKGGDVAVKLAQNEQVMNEKTKGNLVSIGGGQL
jgi:hypothetical protein